MKSNNIVQLDDIINAMQDNMLFHMTYFAKYVPTMKIIDQPDVTIVKSEILDDTFNYVLRAKFSKDNVFERVSSIVSLFKESRTPFSWWVSESDTPENLVTSLINQGLTFKEENIGMYLMLNSFQNSLNNRISFQKVTSYSKLKDFSDIIVSIGGYSDAFEKIYSKIPIEVLERKNELEMYVGYVDDKPVVSGILVLHANVAGIYYVATVPHQRKLGFGTSMMIYLLERAKQCGFSVAVLQASREGKSLYEKLGFKICSVIKEFAG